MRSRGAIGLMVVVVVVALGGVAGCGTYNSLVVADEQVEEAWGNVQSTYQRRLDLIPNLVSTVQGAADFEQETLSQVTTLRSAAVQAQTNFQQAGTIEGQQTALNNAESALGRFLLIMENYPELRATEAFRDLQADIAGTENRINVARTRYNEAVRAYNTTVRRFPAALFAGIFGFERRTPFEADAGAEQAPTVDFNS